MSTPLTSKDTSICLFVCEPSFSHAFVGIVLLVPPNTLVFQDAQQELKPSLNIHSFKTKYHTVAH